MKTSEKTQKALFLSAVVLFWFSQYSFIPHFTPYLTGSLSIPAAAAGIIVSAYGLLQTCLRLPIGIFGSRSSFSKFIMIFGTLALAASSALLISAKSVPVLWCARALAGVAAATWVCFTVFYGDTFSSNGSRSMGYMVSANNLGMMLGYLAAAAFNDLLGIRFLFASSFAAGILSASLLVILFKNMPVKSQSKGASVQDIAYVLRSGKLWFCAFLTALSQLISFATMISFSANYAVSIGCSGTQVGMISVINTVAGLLASSMIASGKLEWISRRSIVSIGFIFMFIYCILVPKCTGVIGLFILQFIGGIGRNFIMTTMMAAAVSDIAPVQKTTAMGIFQSVYGVGMTLGPILMGWLLGRTTAYASAFSVIAVICVFGAGLSLTLKTKADRT